MTRERYPGELERVRCAARTREELRSYAPKRPLEFRDELRIRGQYARCSTCNACPRTIRALAIMLPPEVVAVSAEIIRLAG